jgi:hypothetical protein
VARHAARPGRWLRRVRRSARPDRAPSRRPLPWKKGFLILVTTHRAKFAGAATSGLSTEQERNRAAYGRGFDRFIKMRPIPRQGAMGELFFATLAVAAAKWW